MSNHTNKFLLDPNIDLRSLGSFSVLGPSTFDLSHEPLDALESVRDIASQGASGWSRLQTGHSSPSDSQDPVASATNDMDDETVRDIEQQFGINTHAESITDPERFRLAFWATVDKGRSTKAGIKHTPESGMALQQEPEEMRKGSKKLKPYQLQDVGQACLVDNLQGCVLLLHDMGLGKTIQAIAVCEVNWSGSVLVVVPAMLIDTWLEELKSTVPRRKVYDYRNQVKDRKHQKEIESFDYVIVSYNMVEREFARGQTFARHQELRMHGKTHEVIEPSPHEMLLGVKTKYVPLMHDIPSGILHTICWHRVVCDEGHNLKSNGKTASAVCALRRDRGIYITGTPQQNDHKDWFAAFRFARLDPFSHDEALFKKYFVNKQKGRVNEYGPLDHNRARILSLMVRGISVRRRKDDRFVGKLPLPPIKVTEHPIVQLTPDDGTKFPHHPSSEEECQQNLQHHWDKYETDNQTRKTTSKLAACTRERLKLRRHILAELTRARQASAHPAVTEAPRLGDDSEKITARALTKYKTWLATFEQDTKLKMWRSSVIVATLKIIRDHVKAIRKNEPGSGGGIVVFCQFRPVLDLLRIGVRNEIGHGVGCIPLDGRVGKNDRVKNLERFKAQTSLESLILLTTPKSGGEGLNLPQASCVIVLTPHFNPFVDQQAKCRVIRPGQLRTVNIWTVSMANSIDVRIGFMQTRKTENAESITEWDKKERRAVKEAEGWTEDEFYDEIEGIWVEAPRRSAGQDLEGYEDGESDSEGSEDTNVGEYDDDLLDLDYVPLSESGEE